MNIDLKNEIIENDDITIVGEGEMIKQLLFDVTSEVEGFELISNVNIFSKYLSLSRIENTLFIEDVQDKNGDFLFLESKMLWIDEEILHIAYKNKQQDCFLCEKDIVVIY